MPNFVKNWPRNGRFRQLLTAVMCFMLLLPPQGLAQGTGNELPDIGSPASSTLSLDDEYRIGLQIA
jgi:predicted Zn-dependent protease